MGFFLPVPALAGGATEKNSMALSERFQKRGHDVTIYSRRWPGLANNEVANGIRHIRIPGAAHSRHLVLNLLNDIIWCTRMMGVLEKHDVIISNSVFFPLFASAFGRKAKKTVCWVSRMPKGQMRLYDRVDAFVAPSTAVTDRIFEECPSYRDRILQIPNPIAWHQLSRKSERAMDSSPIRIAYVGRIHPEKNLETLIDACGLLTGEKLPPWTLDLVGPVEIAQGGGGTAYLNQLLSRATPGLRGQLTVHPPAFDTERLAEIYGKTDIFCYPSKAAKGEALSVAPLEAMAAGAVPVVSDLDCYRDYVTPDVNGLCFTLLPQEQSAQSLSISLARLLSSPDERRRMAREAVQTAASFDFEPVADLLLKHFSRMLHKDE